MLQNEGRRDIAALFERFDASPGRSTVRIGAALGKEVSRAAGEL
ncbi:hypothetical protein MPC4_80035 [Methylocella tundrae]|uniref:Uncharacterized protein n=1 Tax=Methylocella tundrae TaxID=227605 RepID=A0A8B6MBS8_METTU|nr:hypothetical protein MPC1_5700001 [Methylocella tundrae]VTZ52364.1 hypothetical protein MPC4_80035 [Methylocella tundrae]